MIIRTIKIIIIIHLKVLLLVFCVFFITVLHNIKTGNYNISYLPQCSDWLIEAWILDLRPPRFQVR